MLHATMRGAAKLESSSHAKALPYLAGLAYTRIALALAAAALVFASREYFIDDAFIHLRIAENFARSGRFEFNPGEPGFATSSPLYTSLLAALWIVFRDPVILKAVNIAAYAALFGVIAVLLTTLPRMAGYLSMAFLAAVTSPMAIRWLTDGMESGFAGLLAVLLAWAVRPPNPRPTRIFLCFVLGLAGEMLRIEFAFLGTLLVAAWAAQAVLRPSEHPPASRPCILGATAGMLVGMAVVFLLFGHLLPDTAVAKSHPSQLSPSAGLDTLVGVARAHAGASFFGIVTAGSWFASFLVVLRRRRVRPFFVTLNAGLPALVALILLRQQAIHGIRYFIFIEFFLIASNVVAIASDDVDAGVRRFAAGRLRSAPAVALAALCVAWWAYDAKRLVDISASTARTLGAIRSPEFSVLQGKRGIAWEVGMLGYFTGAHIVDVHGLVNGRRWAQTPEAVRVGIIESDPRVDFVFGNRGQLDEVARLVGSRSLIESARVDFEGFSGDPNTHYLLVRGRALQ